MNKEYQRHKDNRRAERNREQRRERRQRDFDESTAITDQPKDHSKKLEQKAEKQKAEQLKTDFDGIKAAADSLTQLLSDMIDQDASNTGLVIADIFKTLTKAAAQLPAMELDTEMMYLHVNDRQIMALVELPKDDEDEGGDTDSRLRANGSHDMHENDVDCGDCHLCDCFDEFAEEFGFDFDEEEEGLLYDGD